MTVLPEVLTRYVVEDRGYHTPCWIWTGACKPEGYAEVNWQRRGGANAHRLVYEHLVAPIPDGLQIDHLCRNRSCVNPDHLEPVTPAENTRRGAGTKLAMDDAINIRRRHAAGESQSALAREYGVHPAHVSKIVSGKKWRP